MHRENRHFQRRLKDKRKAVAQTLWVQAVLYSETAIVWFQVEGPVPGERNIKRVTVKPFDGKKSGAAAQQLAHLAKERNLVS
jgi:hypothetical protein